jgi:hypothetical protein
MSGYKIGTSIGLFIISVALIVGLALSLVACTTQEDIELAKMRNADAQARLESARAQGTVNVLREQVNVHTESLRTEADITKELREFELQLERDKLRLHREETASILAESQALIVALKENRAIAENSRAAAENSFWVLVIGVPVIGMNLGLLVLVIFLVLRRQSV